MRVVQEREERKEKDCVAEADEAEEEGHVELEGCALYGGALQGYNVGAVDYGGEEG